MFTNQNRKNKVILTDYNYQRDISSRLLIASLTNFEIEIFKEILNNSLVIPLKQFAENLNISQCELIAFIDKLKPSKLIKIDGANAFVDKETRRYFESHIVKFDEDFEPGMDFLQSLLNKVSLNVLPSWYALPRTSDDIFQSIIEKYLATPKIYERYLQEIQFENPQLIEIVKLLFSSPDYTVTAEEVMKHCHISHDKFEEYTLMLEYNFIGCLSYRKSEHGWEEIITPFIEWHEYLRFKRDKAPKSIQNQTAIKRTHSENFAFVHDMSRILSELQNKPLPIESFEEGFTLKTKEAHKLFPNGSPSYIKNILDKLLIHHFVETNQDKIYALETAFDWLQKSDQEKALTLSRHPVQVEKDLKRVLHLGWIYVDDFLQGFKASLGLKEATMLKNKGKKWKYAMPSYTSQEMAMIKTTLCERLFEAGVVTLGTHEGKACFCVTPFGKSLLED